MPKQRMKVKDVYRPTRGPLLPVMRYATRGRGIFPEEVAFRVVGPKPISRKKVKVHQPYITSLTQTSRGGKIVRKFVNS